MDLGGWGWGGSGPAYGLMGCGLDKSENERGGKERRGESTERGRDNVRERTKRSVRERTKRDVRERAKH